MEEDFHVGLDAKDNGSVHQREMPDSEVQDSVDELPKRVDEVPDVFDGVSRKFKIRSVGWIIVNTAGFLFVATILFFLIMLIVTS